MQTPVRRKRKNVKKWGQDPLMEHEEKLIRIALANSKNQQKFTSRKAPSAKVFRPTAEEFVDPAAYIASIQHLAIETGICKIIPPKGWSPTFNIHFHKSHAKFETKLQRIHRLQEGKDYGTGRNHTFNSYQKQADAFKKKWFERPEWEGRKISSDDIENEYWRIVGTNAEKVEVEYANDLSTTRLGSGFPSFKRLDLDRIAKDQGDALQCQDPDYYKRTGWNLNNLPYWPGCMTRHVLTPINGVNVPWLYCGMLFATFCWHTEDNYLYSINYMHCGAKKRWYGVPHSDATAFEKVMKSSIPLRFGEDPDLLLHLVTMLSPATLLASNVKVYTLVQEPGEFIVTFPQAYHSGFSEGFNCNEAVNFALPSWLSYVSKCTERYRKFGRSSVFSIDRLLCKLPNHLDELKGADCQILYLEIRRLYVEEIELRQDMNDYGIRNVVEMENNNLEISEETLKIDESRMCYKCKHYCFVSAVVCACNEENVSCLRHAREICACPAKQKVIAEWITLLELEAMLIKIEAYMKKHFSI